MPKGPNLFDHATSELSQDAVICWMLRWADPVHVEVDPDLHQLGTRFVKGLFECCARRPQPGDWGTDRPPERVETIEVVRQLANVDVVAVINGTHAFLIEDKTMTREHGGQLKRYKEALLQARADLSRERVYPVYFKLDEQSDLSEVEQANYGHFQRSDLLPLLEGCPSGNEVLGDFREHVRVRDAEIASWRTVPCARWSGLAWKGFFAELQKRFRRRGAQVGWGYVANPAGGFMGFWWGFREVMEPVCHQVYLQLEEGTLCAKIVVNDDERRSDLRRQWQMRIVEAGRRMGMRFEKPARFGRGTFMTVARFAGDYRIPAEHGIDLDATVTLLESAEEVAAEALASA